MVGAYQQKIFSGQKPVFDGRKNLYSRDPLPIGRDKVIAVGYFRGIPCVLFDCMIFLWTILKNRLYCTTSIITGRNEVGPR